MGKITYQYLAERDLKDASAMIIHGSPSSTGRLVQQAIEKSLKQCIEICGTADDIKILSIHNLTKLYDRCVELKRLEFDKEERKMMSVIKDYYFDLNYPGEECRELTKDEATEALEFAIQFVEKINE